MITINGIDFEFPQLNKEPTMGYVAEYIEKQTISGALKRIHKGKRFSASFSYAYLTAEQLTQVQSVLAAQESAGGVSFSVSTPFGEYSGTGFLDVDNRQKRFKYNAAVDEFVWTDWNFSLKSAEVAYD